MSHEILKRLFRVIEQEAAQNHAFRTRLYDALRTTPNDRGAEQPATNPATRPRNKRARAVLDPSQLLASAGEDGLRRQLEPLTSEQLKDIISEFAMDTARLAMKWTNPERLRDHVVATTVARSKKGDAFRE